MIHWEHKKLYWKNRGWLVLLLFAAVELTILTLTLNTLARNTQPSLQQGMDNLYAQFGGELTEEKAQLIEKRQDEIAQAEKIYNETLGKQLSGEIPFITFQNISKKVLPLLQESIAYREFYANYQYALQDTDHRHLIDTRGWQVLNSGGNLDLVLIFTCVILAALACGSDMQKNCAQMIRPTRYGILSLLGGKLLLGAEAGLLPGLLLQGIYGILTATAYPLPDAPMQSFWMYTDSPLNLSLWQGFWVSGLIRILGLMLLGITTVSLVYMWENVVTGSFLSVDIAILPYFAGNQEMPYLDWPVLTGMLQGNVYLTGGAESNRTVGSLMLSLMMYLLILGVLVVVSCLKYRGTYPFGFRRKAR